MNPFLSIQDIRVHLMVRLVAVVALLTNVGTPGLPLGAVMDRITIYTSSLLTYNSFTMHYQVLHHAALLATFMRAANGVMQTERNLTIALQTL